MNVMNFATSQVKTIAPNDSIDKAISLMEDHDIHHLVVVSDERPVGMVSDRDILISTGWMLMTERRSQSDGQARPRVVGPTRIEQIMSRPITGIKERGSAREAACLMLNRGIGALPILRNTRVVGILSLWDLVRWLNELATRHNSAERLLAREVNELMSYNVVSVVPESPLSDVVGLFRQRHIHHLPVAVDSLLVGIISDRDVRRALGWSHIRDAKTEATKMIETNDPATAQDVLQTHVQTVTLADPLRRALHIMLEHRIHSLPVVFKKQLLGILTITDFVKAIAKEDVLSLHGLVADIACS